MSGLLISYCKNVTLYGITVKNSAGCGLVLNQTSGMIQIVDSLFEANCKNESVLAAAGGLYIEFLHSNTDHDSKLVTTAYSIDDCRFVKNRCSLPSFTADSIGFATTYEDFGEGGGMRLLFKHNASNNNITIKNSLFINNHMIWGGGIRVYYLNSPTNNSVVVHNSTFLNNSCDYLGGGLDLAFRAHYTQEMSVWNKLHFEKCVIRENMAYIYGGGVRIYSSRNAYVAMNMSFTQCSFTKNKGLYSPAVDILPGSSDLYSSGYLCSIEFKDCNFSYNTVNQKLSNDSDQHIFEHYTAGKGAFACADFLLYFAGHTIFEENQGSAMYLSSCKLKFKNGSYVNFSNNTGYDGGALVLFGTSVLYVSDNSKIIFFNNTAVHRGGAIMYFSTNDHSYLFLKHCFIQYYNDGNYEDDVNSRSIHFLFLNNSAGIGQAIFAGTLRACYRSCASKQIGIWHVSNNISINESLGCAGNFSFSDDVKCANLWPVVTSGETFVPGYQFTADGFIPVIPGQKLNLEFTMYDELFQPSYDTFYASINNSLSDSRALYIDPAYTYISHQKAVILYGKPGRSARLVLKKTEFHPLVVTANVKMKQCPPGFILDESTEGIKCVCSTDKPNKRYIGITSCNTKNMTTYIRSGYWVGYILCTNKIITGQCPPRFCQYNNLTFSHSLNEFELPQDASLLDTFICAKGRTGKLCGKCRPNHSVFFHSSSYQCQVNDHTCKLSFLLYFVSELLPVTILFVTILLFNIQFTTGSLNSLIFYIQVLFAMYIDLKGLLKFNGDIQFMLKYGRPMLGIFNLNFLAVDELSYCLWDSATMLDIFAIKYITIVYSLILVFVYVFLLNFCNFSWKVRNCIHRLHGRRQVSRKSTIIHGLVTFITICYSQCTELSLSILTPGNIHAIGSVKDHNISTVVYYEGDVSYMHTQHLKYAIPAIFFLITFTIIPPVLLIIYPLCHKLFALLNLEETSFTHCLCMVIPLEKLKPLFDSFQGSFKDKYRFFAGLFFLYRLSALILYSATDSMTLFLTLLEIQFIITLIVHAVVQPYKLHSHNMVDILLLGLLALINAMTMYNYQMAYRDYNGYMNTINTVSGVQVFLICLPLLCAFVHALKILAISNCKRNTVLCLKKSERNDEPTDTLVMLDLRDEECTFESKYSAEN